MGKGPTRRARSPIPGLFDLYDVGSVVGEELGAVRPSHVVGKVEDFDVFKELVHG